jgi:hypothetical protein
MSWKINLSKRIQDADGKSCGKNSNEGHRPLDGPGPNDARHVADNLGGFGFKGNER